MQEVTHMDGVIESLELEVQTLKQTIKDLEMTHEVDLANSAWREREECAKISDFWGSAADRVSNPLQSLVCNDISSAIRARNN